MPDPRIAIAWSLGLVTFVSSCNAPGGSPEVGMHARMNAAFLESEPRVGDPLPDAAGFDEEGRPFALSDTRGRVTVIVAGCVT